MNATLNNNKELEEVFHAVEYPLTMDEISGEISGRGFFPGATGIIDPSKKLSDLDYLVLGQDQDTKRGFDRSVKEGNEEYTPTWKKMKALFETASIDMENCFFTNALLGVRSSEKKNTGKSPGFKSYEFVQACLSVLQKEIEVQKPKAIICLGLAPLNVLKYFSKALFARTLLIEGYQSLDENDLGLIKSVPFEVEGSPKIDVAIIVHPSYRHLNAKNRIFQGKKGDEAELEILKQIRVL